MTDDQVPEGNEAAQLRAWWRQEAAAGHPGGDWIDVMTLPGDRLALTVGDAAGHDGRAWALASLMRAVMRQALAGGLEPAEVLEHSLGEVAALSDMGELYASAFVGVADPGSGLLRYASAGHPEPVLLPGLRDAARSATALAASGPVLSDLFAGRHLWSEQSVMLAANDRLVVYTDGLADARDADNRQFGTGPLVAERLRALPPEQIVPALFADVAAHRDGQHLRDDQSVLVLTRGPGLPRGPGLRGRPAVASSPEAAMAGGRHRWQGQR